MLFLFKSRLRKEESNSPITINNGKQYWTDSYLYLKMKWAHWMTRQWAKLSWTYQKFLLGILLLSAVFYSFYMIHKGITGSTLDSIPSGERIKKTILPEITERAKSKDRLPDD